MKVAVVHGQTHKGSTYHLTHMLLDKLNLGAGEIEIEEFYVNGIGDCTGCCGCILKDEKICPHRGQTEKIITAIEKVDVIIIDSPTYVLSMSGQLKTFFDHMGYRWMTHRPHQSMKGKIGVAISTTAGAGARNTTKQIKTQMLWWYVGKIYQIPLTTSAMSWEQISGKRKEKAEKITTKTAKAILKQYKHVKPGLKAGFIFFMMKKMHKGMSYNPVDKNYWEENGWIR